MATDTANWDGFHRWISGKVLMEDYLYPHPFEPAGLSKSRSRALLIEAGRQYIPAELQELAQRWAT